MQWPNYISAWKSIYGETNWQKYEISLQVLNAEGQAWPVAQNSREEIWLYKSLKTAEENIFNTTLISFSTTKRSQLLLEKHKL